MRSKHASLERSGAGTEHVATSLAILLTLCKQRVERARLLQERRDITMKRTTVAAASIALLLASSAFAETRVGRRQERQQARIAEGVKDGQLTARETAKLGARRQGSRQRSSTFVRITAEPSLPATEEN